MSKDNINLEVELTDDLIDYVETGLTIDDEDDDIDLFIEDEEDLDDIDRETLRSKIKLIKNASKKQQSVDNPISDKEPIDTKSASDRG